MREPAVCEELAFAGWACRLNLLDRHLLLSVVFTCASAVGLFAFVVILPNVVKELITPWLAGQISTAAFLRLMALLFPFAISYALPMGFLTGVLLTLGRLSADSEITAMRASGISIARIAWPVFLLAALCSAIALYINLESAPWARVQFQREFAQAIRANPQTLIVPKTFIRDFKGCVVYVGAREEKKDGSVLKDIWLWELDEQNRVRRLIRAESGKLVFDAATNSLVLTFIRAKIEERNSENPEDFSKSPKVFSVDRIEHLRIPLDRYLSQSARRMKQEWLTYEQLRTEQARHAAETPAVEKRAEHRQEGMKLELIVQEKFSLSLAVLSFAMIGVPLGIKVSRRETSANLGIALVLVLSFYLLTVAIKWLDRHPEVRPDLLLWAPNVIFIGLGLWLYSRIDRR